MNNEKEIMLDSEEIQQLLEGGLFWKDIESKLSMEDSQTFHHQLNVDDEKDDEFPAAEAVVFADYDDDYDDDYEARAILLGENKVIRDRQIDLTHIRELSAACEETEGEAENIAQTAQIAQTDQPGGINETAADYSIDDSENAAIFTNEIENRGDTSFRGWKVVLLIIVVAALTFGFWIYYLGW